MRVTSETGLHGLFHFQGQLGKPSYTVVLLFLVWTIQTIVWPLECTIFYSVCTFRFWVCGRNPMVWPFREGNLLNSAVLSHGTLHPVLIDLRWSPGGGTQQNFIRGAPPQGPTLPIPFNCCKCTVFYLNMNKSQNLTCSANVFLGGRKLLVYVFFISVAAISSLFWSFNVALTRAKTFAHPKKTPALQAA